MEEIFNYNFEAADIADGNYSALFERRRRDSLFAYVFRKDGSLYAVRDHLGNIPLFYTYQNQRFYFATSLSDLKIFGAHLTVPGVTTFLSFRTPKLIPLIDTVSVVPPGSVVRLDERDGSAEVLYRYQMKPVEIPAFARMNGLVAEVEDRFAKAVERQVKSDQVGLYLSGGMDSGLIGVFLKRLGVRIHAYTSAPWGKTSSEIPYAITNAETIGVERHEIDCLESDQYQAAMNHIPDLYGQPHGTSTGVGVSNLWMNTAIGQEKQIFFGQNSDTMTCSVPLQSLVYFLSYLPRILKKHIVDDNVVGIYLSLYSNGLTRDYPPLTESSDLASLSRMQQLSVAGMYIVHSPSDGEVMAQPAILQGIPVANPYYDVDLIEFCLGIPLIHRLQVSRHNRRLFALEKRVLRQFAVKYLPRNIVYRKKAFIVALDRDAETSKLAEQFPRSVRSISVKNPEQRFAAEVLRQWCNQVGIEFG